MTHGSLTMHWQIFLLFLSLLKVTCFSFSDKYYLVDSGHFYFTILTCYCFSDKYYLVDSGYPNRIGYLAPFKGSTYHLLEFRNHRGRPPQGKYEIFNFLHSSLRMDPQAKVAYIESYAKFLTSTIE